MVAVAYEKWSCTGGLIWKALVFWIGRRTWRFDCIFMVLGYQKVFDGVAQRPCPKYSMISFPCFLSASSK